MGQMYGMKCSACGHYDEISTGIGMLFEYNNAKIKEAAIEMAERGIIDPKSGLSKTFCRIVSENPDGRAESSLEIFACSCGGWRNCKDLRYLVPTENGEKTVYRKKHRCPKCKKILTKPMEDPKIEKLPCPRCGRPYRELPMIIMWD